MIILYFLGPQYSLFIIFLAHYSLFIIKKGHYSLIIIPHPDPLLLDLMYVSYLMCVKADFFLTYDWFIIIIILIIIIIPCMKINQRMLQGKT